VVRRIYHYFSHWASFVHGQHLAILLMNILNYPRSISIGVLDPKYMLSGIPAWNAKPTYHRSRRVVMKLAPAQLASFEVSATP